VGGRANLKAASLINNIELARALLGPEKLDALVATLPPETRALFARPLLALEWIPADDWLPFQTALLERAFKNDEVAFRQLVHKVCARDFNTFYKVLMKLASPSYVIERTARLWQTYNDSGELVVARNERVGERTHVTLALAGYGTRHRVFGILLHGFVEQLLRMAGAKQIEVRRTLNIVGAKGLDCELQVSWRT